MRVSVPCSGNPNSPKQVNEFSHDIRQDGPKQRQDRHDHGYSTRRHRRLCPRRTFRLMHRAEAAFLSRAAAALPRRSQIKAWP